MSRVLRNDYTATLKDHGVEHSQGMAQCTNGIYLGFLGRTAKKELRERGLPVTANLRDNMKLVDLTGVMLSEALATEDIKEGDRHGVPECYDASKRSGHAVRKVIDEQRASRKGRADEDGSN